MKTKRPTLTETEWIEIALAVKDKLDRVNSGTYDEEPNDKECEAWAEHLQAILDELGGSKATSGVSKDTSLSNEDWIEIYYALDDDEELQEKIGADGTNMWEER